MNSVTNECELYNDKRAELNVNIKEIIDKNIKKTDKKARKEIEFDKIKHGNRLAANAGFIDKTAGEYLSSLNIEKVKECLEKISISMLQNAHDIWVNRCILYDQDNTKSAGGKWYNNLKQNRHDRYKFIIKHSTVTEEG